MNKNQIKSLRNFQRALATTSALTIFTLLPSNVAAQQSQGAATSVEEIVVTGTRVVRDGYQAPTPLTVVGVQEIQSQAQPNIADFVN